MQIRSIKLKNFRSFEAETEIDFEKCHALIGENGSGKTSILEAINLVTSRSNVANRIDEQDFNNADGGELLIKIEFSKPFVIEIPDGYGKRDIPCSGVSLKAKRREKAASGVALSGGFVVEHSCIPICYEPGSSPSVEDADIPAYVRKTEEGYVAPRKNSNEFKFSERQLSMQSDLVNFPNVFYFDRDRESEARLGFNSLLQKIVKDLNWRFRKDWNQADTLQKWNDFYESVISTVEDAKTSRVLRPLQEKLKAFTGKDCSDLELSLLEIEQPFSKSFFSKRTSTNQVEQKRLGSGVSILLSYFLLEVISKLSKNKFIFLIDEPELHLHPQLQQRLLQEFKAATFQVIYTTQSDCLVDISEWKSITRFLRDSTVAPMKSKLSEMLGGQTIQAHLDEIKKWHQHKSIFFREDNQIFFSNKCLLVEGPAEKYGLPVLAQKLGKDFGDLTIISCNGKTKMPYYQLLCQAFKIPYFTLIDFDGKKEADGENKQPWEGADASGRASFADSFEKVFGVAKSDHKFSDLFIKLDAVKASDVPAEVKTVISSIAKWTAA